MKKLLFITLIASLLFACSKEDLGTVSAVLGREISLKEGQATLYNSNGLETVPAVKLKVEEVSDSRCPSDVVCVAYGRVEVRLSLRTVDGSGESITLCLGDCDGSRHTVDETVVIVGSIPYKIRLLGVNPLPTIKTKSKEEKKVQLVLERL